MSKKLTTEEFIEKAKKVHGDKYDYTEVEYIGAHTPVKIVCPEHGVFEQAPGTHLDSPVGCPSCINVHTSSLEAFTGNALLILGIHYEAQKIFSSCKFLQPLPFDFYLPDHNLLIECQGIQHYEVVDFFNGKIGYIERKRNDMIKKNYCKWKGIKLLEIPYSTKDISAIKMLILNSIFSISA